MAVMRLDVVSYNLYISILVVPVVLKNVSMYGRNSWTELMTKSNSDIGHFLLSYVCYRPVYHCCGIDSLDTCKIDLFIINESNMITHAALCTSSQFRCDNGQCVSSSFRCNGRTGGCTDGSDERGCSKLTLHRTTILSRV